MPHHTATKGNIGVAKATADLLIRGWDVLEPVCSTSPFDLVAYADGSFVRIQVKYRTPTDGAMEVKTARHSVVPGRYAKSTPNTEIDVVCIYDGAKDRCYYVPAARCPITLRTEPPRNGQVRGINLATQFTVFEPKKKGPAKAAKPLK